MSRRVTISKVMPLMVVLAAQNRGHFVPGVHGVHLQRQRSSGTGTGIFWKAASASRSHTTALWAPPFTW
jgi:hypothetical protein